MPRAARGSRVRGRVEEPPGEQLRQVHPTGIPEVGQLGAAGEAVGQDDRVGRRRPHRRAEVVLETRTDTS